MSPLTSVPWNVDYGNMTEEEYDLAVEELYEPRKPMDILPAKYQVTETNPNPPLLHFGIPVSYKTLIDYAKKEGVVRYLKHSPNEVSPSTVWAAVDHLTWVCSYKLTMKVPFLVPRGCGAIVQLYSNYTMWDKQLVKAHEDKLLEIIKDELGLDQDTQARWYFDSLDPWKPGDKTD